MSEKETTRVEINNLISELLEEFVEHEDNSIVFTSRSVELIHEIADNCTTIPIIKDTKEQAERCAKDLSAEEVYLVMLNKIADAPTQIHMIVSIKMLIPIISRKLKERETKNEQKRNNRISKQTINKRQIKRNG